MKTKNSDNEVVTRGILKETLGQAFERFGETFGVHLLEKIEIMIDTKIDTKIGDLAIMIQKGFLALHEEIRVGKLEKKVK